MKYIKPILQSIGHRFNRKLPKQPEPYKVNYHEKWLLPPLAVFVGIYIVLYAHPRSFGEAILMPDFYKAAIPSVLCAWVVMWCIVQATYVLDDRYPWAITWYRGPLARMGLQLFFGIAMPAFFIFGVFAGYFLLRSRGDLLVRYALEDFPFVLLMLLGFNVLTWFFYRRRAREIMQKFRAWRREHGKTLAEMEARWTGHATPSESFIERMRKEVALFEPGGDDEIKGTWALLFTGQRELQLQSVDELVRMLAGPDFYLVYRAVLVNRAAIAEVRDEDGTTDVVLLESLGGRVIRVSRRYRVRFLRWWYGE